MGFNIVDLCRWEMGSVGRVLIVTQWIFGECRAPCGLSLS